MRAIGDSFAKLDPRVQIKNPVMFLVYVSAILTSILFVCSLFGVKDAGLGSGFVLAIAVILWFTCLFANFAEAIAEGRGKAQADALRAAKRDVEAHSDEQEAVYAERIAAIRAAHPEMGDAPVPVDLVTESGSGLDPEISPEAAEYQVKRIAANTDWTEDEVRQIIARYTTGRLLGIFGEPRVNVLKVNLALDGILKE